MTSSLPQNCDTRRRTWLRESLIILTTTSFGCIPDVAPREKLTPNIFDDINRQTKVLLSKEKLEKTVTQKVDAATKLDAELMLVRDKLQNDVDNFCYSLFVLFRLDYDDLMTYTIIEHSTDELRRELLSDATARNIRTTQLMLKNLDGQTKAEMEYMLSSLQSDRDAISQGLLKLGIAKNCQLDVSNKVARRITMLVTHWNIEIVKGPFGWYIRPGVDSKIRAFLHFISRFAGEFIANEGAIEIPANVSNRLERTDFEE